MRTMAVLASKPNSNGSSPEGDERGRRRAYKPLELRPSSRGANRLKPLFAMIGDDPPAMAEPGDIIIEFYRVGAYVKVSAVDTASLTEVSIVGDPAAGEEALKRAAVRKLEYVLARKAGAPRRAGL